MRLPQIFRHQFESKTVLCAELFPISLNLWKNCKGNLTKLNCSRLMFRFTFCDGKKCCEKLAAACKGIISYFSWECAHRAIVHISRSFATRKKEKLKNETSLCRWKRESILSPTETVLNLEANASQWHTLR